MFRAVVPDEAGPQIGDFNVLLGDAKGGSNPSAIVYGDVRKRTADDVSTIGLR